MSRSASTAESSDANDRFLADTTRRWRRHEGLKGVEPPQSEGREAPESARLVHCHRPRLTSLDRTDIPRSALAIELVFVPTATIRPYKPETAQVVGKSPFIQPSGSGSVEA